MNGRVHVCVVLVALAGAGCCVRSCVGAETTARHRGRVPMEVKKSTRVFNAGIHTFYDLHVGATPPYDVSVTCEAPELAEKPDATAIAWRCPGKGWQLSRLEGAHHFEQCEVLGEGAAPDFAAVKPLAASAAEVVRCALGDGAADVDAVLAWLVPDVRAAADATAVAALFADSMKVEASRPPDPWTTAVAPLGADERAALHQRVCGTLLDAPQSHVAFLRAARVCPLGDAEATAALAFLTSGAPVPSRLLPWLALAAARDPGDGAGRAACEALEAGRPWAAVFAAVVGVTKTPCPAARALECAQVPACDGGVCSEPAVRARLDAWLAHADLAPGAVRPLDLRLPEDAAFTAAALAQGPLDAALVKRRERFEYTRVEGDGPPCTEAVDAGTPCRCLRPPGVEDVCAAPLDATAVTLHECTLALDDVKRTLGPARRHCLATAGVECTSSFDCCAPLQCRGFGPQRCTDVGGRDAR